MIFSGCSNLVFDHNSFTWVGDQTVNHYGSNISDITWQWNIIGEGYEATHNAGSQFSGGFPHDRVTVHHNYMVHTTYRNYQLVTGTYDFINNVNYNTADWDYHINQLTLTGSINSPDIINHYFKEGPDSRRHFPFDILRFESQGGGADITIYLSGNEYYDINEVLAFDPNDQFGMAKPRAIRGALPVYTERATPHAVTPTYPVTTQTAAAGKDLVLANAGARLPRLDAVDRRLLEDFYDGGGWNLANVEVYPTLSTYDVPTDTDSDGMPDSWETANGTNPAVADDDGDLDGDGYTNIEEWINGTGNDEASAPDTVSVDSAGGGDFTTIQAAVDVAVPGDVIIVEKGTYKRETGENYIVFINQAGTAASPIIIQAADVDSAILDAEGLVDYGILTGPNAQYIQIKDFEITGANISGIFINSQSENNITISGNEIHSNGNVSDCCTGECTSRSGIFQGINTSNITYDSNIIRNNGRTPEGCSSDFNNDHGIACHGSNNTFTNNLFYENVAGWAIALLGGGSGNFIGNNTFSGTNTGIDGLLLLDTNESNTTIQNNIFYEATTCAILAINGQTQSNITARNNLTYSTPLTSTGNDYSAFTFTNNISGLDPFFEDFASNDFHIQSNSPGVDAGTSISAPTVDLDDIDRPQGLNWDIGAYEFVGGVTPAGDTTMYVSPNGSSTSPFNTWATADTTISSLISNVVLTGGTVIYLDGGAEGDSIVYAENIAITTSDDGISDNSRVTFRTSDEAGHNGKVIIKPSSGTNVVNVTGSYVTFFGGSKYRLVFDADNVSGDAIDIDGSSGDGADGNILEYVEIRNSWGDRTSAGTGDAISIIGGTSGSSTLNTSLVSFWKLDEASGTRSDEIGSNDLTDNATVAQVAGKLGNAADFEQDNEPPVEHLSIADNSSLSTGDIDYTFAFWVNRESDDGADKTVVSKASTGALRWEYQIYYDDSSDEYDIAIYPGTNIAIARIGSGVGSASATGTWDFVVAGQDATNNQAFIQINNGTRQTVALSGTSIDGTSAFLVGSFDTNGLNQWDGGIDAMGFWKKTLSLAEVSDLYNSGTGRETPFSGSGGELSSGNIVRFSRIVNYGTEGAAGDDGISIGQQTAGTIIDDVELINPLGGAGIRIHSGSGGTSEDHIIRNNRSDGTSSATDKTGLRPGISVDSTYGGGHLIYNNLLWDQEGSEYAISLQMDSSKAYNNTLWNNDNGIIVLAEADTAEVVNNIVYSASTITDNGTRTRSTTNTTADPSFVSTDPTSADFLKVGQNSAARDVGTTLTVFSVDLLSTVRPQGGAWDIGALEHIPNPTIQGLVSENRVRFIRRRLIRR
jgi:hypothetical protein